MQLVATISNFTNTDIIDNSIGQKAIDFFFLKFYFKLKHKTDSAEPLAEFNLVIFNSLCQ